MVKKYLVIKLCLMLLAITAMPLPVLAVEEAAQVPCSKTMCQNLLKGKEKFKPLKALQRSGFVNEQRDEGVRQPKPVKGKGFLQSRFYLSNYLER